jgi:hypothetical protein
MTAASIQLDPCASFWLKHALETALRRDPCDALADAEALVEALRAERAAGERYELAQFLGYEKGAAREYDDARAAESLLAYYELPTDACAVRAFWQGQALQRTGAKWGAR